MFYFAAGVAAQIVKYPRYEFLIIWLFRDQTANILLRPVYISFDMYVIVLHRPIKQLQKLQNIPVERSVIKIKNKSLCNIYIKLTHLVILEEKNSGEISLRP